jgi:hypothetical protein
MQRSFGRIVMLAVATVAFTACNDDNGSNPVPVTPPPLVPTIVSATGNISAKIDEFRTLLGDPSNGGTAGEQPSGRR